MPNKRGQIGLVPRAANEPVDNAKRFTQSHQPASAATTETASTAFLPVSAVKRSPSSMLIDTASKLTPLIVTPTLPCQTIVPRCHNATSPRRISLV